MARRAACCKARASPAASLSHGLHHGERPSWYQRPAEECRPYTYLNWRLGQIAFALPSDHPAPAGHKHSQTLRFFSGERVAGHTHLQDNIWNQNRHVQADLPIRSQVPALHVPHEQMTFC